MRCTFVKVNNTNQNEEGFLKYLSITMLFIFMGSLSFQLLNKNADERFTKSIGHHEEFIAAFESDSYKKSQKTTASISSFIKRHYYKSKSFSDTVARVIVNESELNNIDPYLVASIIGAESSFNKNAKSYVGAIGLMQVMPFWKKEKGLNFSRTKKDNLHNVAVNIKYGCGIIAKYIKDNDKDIIKALSAYNGSKGSLKYPKKIKKHHDSLAKFVFSHSKLEIKEISI